METHRVTVEIKPDQTYSVSEAARYLGIHRCTIYVYVLLPNRPLPFIQVPGKVKIRFLGSDLIAFKAAGLPKRGRKIREIVSNVPLSCSRLRMEEIDDSNPLFQALRHV